MSVILHKEPPPQIVTLKICILVASDIPDAECRRSEKQHETSQGASLNACSKHRAGTFIRRRCMNKALIIIFREIGVPNLCFYMNFCKITM